MTKADYAKERLDPRWQKKRLEIMERDGFRCCSCEREDKTLNVHHAYYVTGRKPWSYPSFSLSTLCWECHKNQHAAQDDDNEEWYPGLFEWENEMDWLLAGNGKNQGAFWYLAATISEIVKTAPSPDVAYKEIEKTLQARFCTQDESNEK